MTTRVQLGHNVWSIGSTCLNLEGPPVLDFPLCHPSKQVATTVPDREFKVNAWDISLLNFEYFDLHMNEISNRPGWQVRDKRAIQLANSVPTLRRYICDAVTKRSNITNQSLWDQRHQLVLRPLSKLEGNSNSCYSSYVLIIDALDECDNVRIILQLLAEARSLQGVRLRVSLTSRPEIPIRYGFNQIPDVFTPAVSIVRKQFKDFVPCWMRRSPEVDCN
jgi:hypothetical protein